MIKINNMEKVKIPASHLRAGNIHEGVKISIPILNMYSVTIEGKAYAAISAYGISLIETGIIDFTPIHLTDEWLKKLGFIERIKGKEWYHPLTMNFVLFKLADTLGYYRAGRKHEEGSQEFIYCFSERFYYVHQLQNFYFASTEKELELSK